MHTPGLRRDFYAFANVCTVFVCVCMCHLSVLPSIALLLSALSLENLQLDFDKTPHADNCCDRSVLTSLKPNTHRRRRRDASAVCIEFATSSRRLPTKIWKLNMLRIYPVKLSRVELCRRCVRAVGCRDPLYNSAANGRQVGHNTSRMTLHVCKQWSKVCTFVLSYSLWRNSTMRLNRKQITTGSHLIKTLMFLP